MSQTGIKLVSGRAIVVPGDDIDTDQIIPARYLRCVTFDDLAEGLFHDVRFDPDGKSKGHPLDSEEGKIASILISDEHFGCGSSREHAPQAIMKGGFQGIIAGSFAEIFLGNATGLGIPCVTMSSSDRQTLKQVLMEYPHVELQILIEEASVRIPELELEFKVGIKESARLGFLDGSYDPLNQLLKNADLAKEIDAKLP